MRQARATSASARRAAELKRWVIGTLHYGIDGRQLPYYLDEFTFRFNRRDAHSRGLLFYRLLQQAVATDPQPLKDLVLDRPLGEKFQQALDQEAEEQESDE